jgi:hypothetical protein
MNSTLLQLRILRNLFKVEQSKKIKYPALGLTQSPIHWVPGVKWLRCETDRSSPSSAEVKNV